MSSSSRSLDKSTSGSSFASYTFFRVAVSLHTPSAVSQWQFLSACDVDVDCSEPVFVRDMPVEARMQHDFSMNPHLRNAAYMSESDEESEMKSLMHMTLELVPS